MSHCPWRELGVGAQVLAQQGHQLDLEAGDVSRRVRGRDRRTVRPLPCRCRSAACRSERTRSSPSARAGIATWVTARTDRRTQDERCRGEGRESGLARDGPAGRRRQRGEPTGGERIEARLGRTDQRMHRIPMRRGLLPSRDLFHPRGLRCQEEVNQHPSMIGRLRPGFKRDFSGLAEFRGGSDQNRSRELQIRAAGQRLPGGLALTLVGPGVGGRASRNLRTRRTRRRTSRETRASRSRVSRPTWNRWPRHWTRELTMASNQSGRRRKSLIGLKSSCRSLGNGRRASASGWRRAPCPGRPGRPGRPRRCPTRPRTPRPGPRTPGWPSARPGTWRNAIRRRILYHRECRFRNQLKPRRRFTLSMTWWRQPDRVARLPHQDADHLVLGQQVAHPREPADRLEHLDRHQHRLADHAGDPHASRPAPCPPAMKPLSCRFSMIAPEWLRPRPANRFVTSPTPGSAR